MNDSIIDRRRFHELSTFVHACDYDVWVMVVMEIRTKHREPKTSDTDFSCWKSLEI